MKKEAKAAAKLVKSPTPPGGTKIAKAGAKLTGLGVGTLAAAAGVPVVPEVPDSWVRLIQAAGALVGGLATLAGVILTAVGKGQSYDAADV